MHSPTLPFLDDMHTHIRTPSQIGNTALLPQYTEHPSQQQTPPELTTRRARGRLAQARFRQRQVDTIKSLEGRVSELEASIQRIRAAARRLGVVLDISASLDEGGLGMMVGVLQRAVVGLEGVIEEATMGDGGEKWQGASDIVGAGLARRDDGGDGEAVSETGGEEHWRKRRRLEEDDGQEWMSMSTVTASPESRNRDQGRGVREGIEELDGVMRTLLSMPCAESQERRPNCLLEQYERDWDTGWTLADKNVNLPPGRRRVSLAEKVVRESRAIPSDRDATFNLFRRGSWGQPFRQGAC